MYGCLEDRLKYFVTSNIDGQAKVAGTSEKVYIIYFSKGELGGNVGGEVEMTVVLSI